MIVLTLKREVRTVNGRVTNKIRLLLTLVLTNSNIKMIKQLSSYAKLYKSKNV